MIEPLLLFRPWSAGLSGQGGCRSGLVYTWGTLYFVRARGHRRGAAKTSLGKPSGADNVDLDLLAQHACAHHRVSVMRRTGGRVSLESAVHSSCRMQLYSPACVRSLPTTQTYMTLTLHGGMPAGSGSLRLTGARTCPWAHAAGAPEALVQPRFNQSVAMAFGVNRPSLRLPMVFVCRDGWARVCTVLQKALF